MNQVLYATKLTFDQLTQVLSELDVEQYSRPLTLLSDNTVGKHIRHIIEVYQVLISSYDGGIVDYDKRLRNTDLENDLSFSITSLHQVFQAISSMVDKSLILHCGYDDRYSALEKIQTSFHRELAYSLEHCIHHMAIIRIAIGSNFPEVNFPFSFGIAASTLRYMEQCAQ